MKETIYRLGEYKIIESDTGQLMWETHSGFGEIQKGWCFRKGSILFIGSAESYQNGFLKGEFLDDLKKYPKWGKTKFYCTGAGVRHCKNGKSVTKDKMMLWTLRRDREAAKTFSNGASAGKVAENAVYRLQRYEIAVGADGRIISKTYSGSNSVSCGNCYILENILFIGPQKNKPSSFDKRQFLASLQQRPLWDQTAYFSKKFFLHECKPGNEVKEEREKMLYQANAMKKYGAGNKYKNDLETKLPNGVNKETFSARVSSILGSFADFTERRGEYDRLSHFRFIKSYISKSIAIFRESGIRILERIIRTVAPIFFITAALFVFLIGNLKKQYKRWNSRRKEHSLNHHDDQ